MSSILSYDTRCQVVTSREQTMRPTAISSQISSPTKVSLTRYIFHVNRPTPFGAWNCSLYDRKFLSCSGFEKGTSVIFIGGTMTLFVLLASTSHQASLQYCQAKLHQSKSRKISNILQVKMEHAPNHSQYPCLDYPQHLSG